ncbi:MAG: lipid-A-disaccharide synthase [Planctomycetota bacterium]|nr:MAG: lipid-A-disaccharide synthase [Planctomycetota bacterium]
MAREKHIFLVAGEESGDHHGAQLVRQIRRLEPSVRFSGLGGPRMEREGVFLLEDLTRYAVMGISQVIGQLGTFVHLLRRAIHYLWREGPDLVVLIDYPGFNLALAKRIQRYGIPIFYYISPQVWAWAAWRIKKMARWVRKMLVILPFEEELFRGAGLEVEYVGHPTIDFLGKGDFHKDVPSLIQRKKKEGRLIGLLPGSRRKEIRQNLPLMLRVAERLKRREEKLQFLIAAASPEIYRLILSLQRGGEFEVDVMLEKAHYLMAHSHFCLVTSGTATLELTYFATPMVILYRVDWISKQFCRYFLSVSHIGLPNILAGREIVPEFLISSDEVDRVEAAAWELISSRQRRLDCVRELREVKEGLEKRTNASANAARAVVEFLF